MPETIENTTEAIETTTGAAEASAESTLTEEQFIQQMIDEATGEKTEAVAPADADAATKGEDAVADEEGDDKAEGEADANQEDEKGDKKDEEAESIEDKAARLRHDDYTRKTQALAKEKEAFEAEKTAVLAEIERLKSETEQAGKPQVEQKVWEDLPMIDLDEKGSQDEDYVAAINTENARISAINSAGKLSHETAQKANDLVGVVGEMFRDLSTIYLDNAYLRTQHAVAQEFEGLPVTREQFNKAIMPVVAEKGAFAYRELASLSDEQLRGIFKNSNSEVIIKGLEDKVRNKPEKTASKPPATVSDAASGNVKQPEVPKEDWDDPAFVEWWIENQSK